MYTCLNHAQTIDTTQSSLEGIERMLQYPKNAARNSNIVKSCH